MALTKYKLGDLIEQTFETNFAGKYLASDVKGMTITKEIIPTKSDVSNTDLSKFIVVNPNEFIYNPRTHGKKIGLAYNDTQKSFIISWNNIAFRVKESMKNVVKAQYLFLYFNRAEWDRQACFHSWGSSTEVFTWVSLCDMELYLPPLEVQEKFVAVYNSLIENKKVYERGLDDLKLVCDGYIDQLKHTVPKIMIGELLKEIDERNFDGKFKTAYGINITKNFMPSVASSEDLRRYKIVSKNQFAYSGMQTGRDECIRIALHKDDTPIIISPAYSVLKRKSDLVLEEYIYVWFLRTEIDRLGSFMSDSSVRANLELQRFFEMEMPIPSLEIQKSIAAIYEVYRTRQKILERLKEQIKKICPILIKGSLDEGAQS